MNNRENSPEFVCILFSHELLIRFIFIINILWDHRAAWAPVSNLNSKNSLDNVNILTSFVNKLALGITLITKCDSSIIAYANSTDTSRIMPNENNLVY